jgi:hypothetical protein
MYTEVPLGLDPSRGDNMLPEHASVPTPLPPGDSEQLLVLHEGLADLAEDELDKALEALQLELMGTLEKLIASTLADIAATDPGSAAHASDNYAIVDSGASRTYVEEAQKLMKATAGRGSVRAANGQSSPIVEEGSLGAITGAQKVQGFTRTLVSVMDLVEQFGLVFFDLEGVSILSLGPNANGPPLITRIGHRTPTRLFSFDLKALDTHVAAMKAMGCKGTNLLSECSEALKWTQDGAATAAAWGCARVCATG